MADLNILTLPGGVTTSITGGYVYIILPAATPSGFQEYRISTANFLAAVNSSITTINNTLTAYNTRIEDVEGYNTRTRYFSVSASFSFTINSDEVLEYIMGRYVSGAPIVSVGTTLGGSDLMVNTPLNISSRSFIIDFVKNPNVSDTYYITITGGNVTFVTFKKTGVFS